MRTALLVIGYNRPEATARLLEALSADEDGLDRVEIHHYLDGGPGADQDGVVAAIEASEVPYSGLVCRPENYGIGRHLIGARRDLFELKGYDRVLLIEDDVLPGPRFISTTLALADWAERYDDVGTVQVWNHTTLSEPDLIDSMDVVVPTNGHFFTYCMGKRVWNRIQSILTYYEEVYLRDVAYAKKDWRGIRKHLIKPIAKRPRAMIRGTTLDLRGAEIPAPFPAKGLPRIVPTSQDGITALALWTMGYTRLATLAPRCRYLGATGAHFVPRDYKRWGFHEQAGFEWAGDPPSGFTLGMDPTQGAYPHGVYR